MQVLNSDFFYQYISFSNHNNFYIYYIKSHVLIKYVYKDNFLFDFQLFKLSQQTFQRITLPGYYELKMLLKSLPDIKFLHTIFPYTEESHFIYQQQQNRLLITVSPLIINDNQPFITRYVKKTLLSKNLLSLPMELKFPDKRRLYCRNTSIHSDFYPTGLLIRCFIEHCPCKNLAWIGRCNQCGYIVHECIYKNCLFTYNCPTEFNLNIIQYQKFSSLKTFLRRHFNQKHSLEFIQLRTDNYQKYENSYIEKIIPKNCFI